MVAYVVPATPRHRRGWRYVRNLVAFGLLSAVLVISILGAIYGLLSVNDILYPARHVQCCNTPADEGYVYEEIIFDTADKVSLSGWYLPSQNGAAVVLSHGLGCNKGCSWFLGKLLQTHGYGVLLYDLRMHGESGGEAFTQGWEDVLAALHWLQARPEVDAQRIGAWGFSLGAVMTVQAATQTTDLRALALDGLGPATLYDLPAHQTPLTWPYLFYDLTSWIALANRSAPLGGFALLSTKDALATMSPRPLLFVASTGDPFGFEKASVGDFYHIAHQPKTLWEVPNATHGAAHLPDPQAYEDKIVGFFDAALH